MSDALRRVYEGQGALDRYFDGNTPVDLFRGRREGDSGEIMQPTLVGWYARLQPRDPDVLVVNDDEVSPQYQGGDLNGDLVTENRRKPVTAELLRNADRYVVKGCRTMTGRHRGVSVFDKKNPGLPSFEWFRLPAGTALPDGLAVTRDAAHPSPTRPNHYTVAPKDDMSLSLFLQQLKTLGDKTVKD